MSSLCLVHSLSFPKTQSRRLVETRGHYPVANNARQIAEEATPSIESFDLKGIGVLMDRNQSLLHEAEVSCPELDLLVDLCMKVGKEFPRAVMFTGKLVFAAFGHGIIAGWQALRGGRGRVLGQGGTSRVTECSRMSESLSWARQGVKGPKRKEPFLEARKGSFDCFALA